MSERRSLAAGGVCFKLNFGGKLLRDCELHSWTRWLDEEDKVFAYPPRVSMIWYRHPTSGKLTMGPQGAYHGRRHEQRCCVENAVTEH